MSDVIYRLDFDTQSLVSRFPPQVHDRNKRIVFDLASPLGATHSGRISLSRWNQLSLPDAIRRHANRPSFELSDGFFDYQSSDARRVHWYLNFAHFDLFCAYGGGLFAQDEMQVAEHPALASVRHALIESGHRPLTVEEGRATPILIMGVERRCAVATDVNLEEGRPFGLYGNAFAAASEDAIERATQVLLPPTTSNILAMEAPACGAGQYTQQVLEFVLCTALTGFCAAVQESQRAVSSDVQTVIHTGYWGCGAYGGNRALMPLLQMIAACQARVDTVVFHSGGDADGYRQSHETLERILPAGAEFNTPDLLEKITEIGFAWGVSDGN